MSRHVKRSEERALGLSMAGPSTRLTPSNESEESLLAEDGSGDLSSRYISPALGLLTKLTKV